MLACPMASVWLVRHACLCVAGLSDHDCEKQWRRREEQESYFHRIASGGRRGHPSGVPPRMAEPAPQHGTKVIECCGLVGRLVSTVEHLPHRLRFDRAGRLLSGLRRARVRLTASPRGYDLRVSASEFVV